MTFELLATDGRARRGRLVTPHGVVDTPAFMPVGTRAAVKDVQMQLGIAADSYPTPELLQALN